MKAAIVLHLPKTMKLTAMKQSTRHSYWTFLHFLKLIRQISGKPCHLSFIYTNKS